MMDRDAHSKKNKQMKMFTLKYRLFYPPCCDPEGPFFKWKGALDYQSVSGNDIMWFILFPGKWRVGPVCFSPYGWETLENFLNLLPQSPALNLSLNLLPCGVLGWRKLAAPCLPGFVPIYVCKIDSVSFGGGKGASTSLPSPFSLLISNLHFLLWSHLFCSKIEK